MNLFRSLQTISRASGEGPIDWTAVGRAARDATSPGAVDLSDEEVAGYRGDVRDRKSVV